jgi:hypothetical protein
MTEQIAEWFKWIWLGGWLLITVAGTYQAGREPDSDLVFPSLFFGAAWPMFIIGALVVAPFVGLYCLGRRHQ